MTSNADQTFMSYASVDGVVPNVTDRLINFKGDEKSNHPSPKWKTVYTNPVQFIRTEYEAFVNHYREELEREDRNHKYFTALDYNQWPDEIKQKVMAGEETRDLSQYNLMHKKVNGIVGTVTKNPTDISYMPVSSQDFDGSILCKSLMMRDKELTSWDSELQETMKDGVIYAGYVKIGITDKYSPIGNISLERIGPGKIMPSPHWRSNTMKDCPCAITVTYMTGYEAIERYPHMKDIIDARIRDYANNSNYTPIDKQHAIVDYELHEFYGERYRFIEYHHMVTEKVTRMVAAYPDGTYVEVPNPPSTLKDEESVKTWIDKWMEVNGINPDGVIKIPGTMNRYYLATACPELSADRLFVDDRSNVQIGRLPFFNFAYERHEGRNMGVIDLLADPQTTFNKRMSMISQILGHSAKAGMVFDPAMFDGDDSKIREMKNNANKPGFIIDTTPGFLQQGGKGFQEIPTVGNVAQNNAAMNANQMFDMISQLTPQNTAMEGINESSKETGRLFNFKREQGEINMAFLYENVAKLKKELGEAYFYLMQSLYSGLYRVVPVKDGQSLVINEPAIDTYGMTYLKNDVSQIPRQAVVVGLAASGITQRTNTMVTTTELMRIMPGEAALTKLRLFAKLIENMAEYSDDQKEAIMQSMGIEIEVIKSTMEATVANNKAATAAAQAQMQQLQAPPPPPEQAGQIDQGDTAPTGMPGGGQEQMPVRTPAQMEQ